MPLGEPFYCDLGRTSNFIIFGLLETRVPFILSIILFSHILQFVRHLGRGMVPKSFVMHENIYLHIILKTLYKDLIIKLNNKKAHDTTFKRENKF